MANWRLAKSLETLRNQLNAMFPNRSKVSDGTVGDLRHSKRKSDHNPNSAGVVTAFDVTFDTNPNDGIGVDCRKLAQVLLNAKDKRIKYLIFEGQITVQNGYGIIAGWKKYTGTNPHRQHMHISVSSNPKLYDDAKEWNLTGLSSVSPSANPTAPNPTEKPNNSSGVSTPIDAPVFHLVKSGDTIWGISRKYGISELQLKRLNNINTKSSLIKIGQRLRVK